MVEEQIMDLEILYTLDKGELKNERIVLRVINDCNVGDYILFDTTYLEDGFSNKVRHSYWFPDKHVKAGDKIILYTNEGEEGIKLNKSGHTSHFFHWDLQKTVWNVNKDCAVIVKVEAYNGKIV
jgi:hydrogenase maturation factor